MSEKSTNLHPLSVEEARGWERLFLTSLREAVHRGGLEPFAEHIGRNYNTIKSGFNPDNGCMAAHAAWVPHVLNFFDTDEPLHVLARMRRSMLVSLPEATLGDEGCDMAMAKAVRDVGEMMTCHAEHGRAVSAGGCGITRQEWRERGMVAYRALVALAAYQRYCAEKSKP